MAQQINPIGAENLINPIDDSFLADNPDLPPDWAVPHLPSGDFTTQLPPVTPPKTPGMGAQIWNTLTEPNTTIFSRGAQKLNQALGIGEGYKGANEDPRSAFGAGALESAGHYADSLTSLLGGATALAGAGEGAAIEALASNPEVLQLARYLQMARRGLSVPFAVHGGATALDSDKSLGERLFGAAEMAGGAAGALHAPMVSPLFQGEIPGGARNVTSAPPEPPPELGTGQQLLPPRRFNLADTPPSAFAPRPPVPPTGPFVSGGMGVAEPHTYPIDFGQSSPENIRLNAGVANAVNQGRAPTVLEHGATPNPSEVVQVPPEIAAQYGTGLGQPKYQINQPEGYFGNRPRGPSLFSTPKTEPQPEITPITDDLVTPQEMRVPGTMSEQSGLPNLAMGGAEPEVLDALGTSLYARDPEITSARELTQNAVDEHLISSQSAPVRAAIIHKTTIPQTQGEEGKSFIIRDYGRGMTPDQLYTKFSNLGQSGKDAEEGARGGFGFAKASPFLGGRYMEVTSVVDENGQKVTYHFRGTPEEFKAQQTGVEMNRDVVDSKTPTGTSVQVWYGNKARVYALDSTLRNLWKGSSSNPSPLRIANIYDESNYSPDEMHDYLINQNNRTFYSDLVETPEPPPEQGRISVPGADVAFHYDPAKSGEHAATQLYLQNKGLYQATTDVSYGQSVPNVPPSMMVNIIATVKERTANYPFSLNREQIADHVTDAIHKWVDENIASGAKREAVERIQRMYDGITTLPNTDISYLDSGGKLTPEEIKMFRDSPEFQRGLESLNVSFRILLQAADKIGWESSLSSGPIGNWKPSDRLKKFGLIFQEPEGRDRVFGIHIPRPDDPKNSAILINLFEHLKDVQDQVYPNQQLASSLFSTLAHEIAHIPGGAHGTDFSYRDATLRSELGARQTIDILDALMQGFGDVNDRERINPALQNLLQVYNESRTRSGSGSNDLLSTGVYSKRPSSFSGGKGKNDQGVGQNPTGSKFVGSGKSEGIRKSQFSPKESLRPEKPEQVNVLDKIWLSPRSLKIQGDISYALRQGKPFIAEPSFWKGVNAMRKVATDEQVYHNIDENVVKGNKWYELGQQVGLYLPDLEATGKRPEGIPKVNWVEKVPVAGKLYFKPTNRMNTMFLRVLRQEQFSSMMDAAEDMDMDLKEAAKGFAYDVNTLTGQASLDFEGPTFKVGGKEYAPFTVKGEKAARFANYLFFAARFAASRLKTYGLYGKAILPLPDEWIGMNPIERQTILKSLFAVTSLALAYKSLAGATGNKQETDPTSSDFLKTKVGDTRYETLMGLQKYIVFASRLMSGHEKSSTTGEKYVLGSKYGYQDLTDVIIRFAQNMSSPWISKGMEMGRALHGPLWKGSTYSNASSYGKPFKLGLGGTKRDSMFERVARTPFENQILNTFTPMIAQDTYEVLNSNPKWINLVLGPVGSFVGEGVQTYEK
jgi:hypothetical protein